MKEIFRKIKAFYVQKKRLAVGVTVAMLGLLAAVGVYAMIPEVKAADGSASDPIPLQPGETEVEPGKYYQISGSFTNTYRLKYKNSADADQPVYLILDRVNGVMSGDRPAIEFTGIKYQRDDINAGVQGNTYTSGSSSKANFHVIIKGENRITGVSNAKNPLISAERLSYVVKTYGVQWDFDDENLNFSYARVLRDCNVSFNGSGIDDVLILETGSGSTGAAIGSADVESLDSKIVLDSNANITGGAGIATTDYTDPATGITYKPKQETIFGNIKYGVGNITINHGASIIITGKGSGAGIGTGASASESITYTIDGQNQTGTVRAEDLMDGDHVTILGGSVAVHMSENALGCCIGSGAVEGRAVKRGVVEIRGGNVDLVPGTNGYEFGEARNNGTKVFKFIMDLRNVSTFSYNQQIPLEDVEGERGTEVYATYMKNSTDTKDSSLDLQVDADIANGSVPGANIADYHFTGYAKTYFERFGYDYMYFYLPTAALDPYQLTITGDLDDIDYSYTINGGAELSYDRPVMIKERKNIVVKLSNVPANCKSVTCTMNGAPLTVSKDVDGTYSVTFQMPSAACNLEFSYEIAKYKIRYDFGIATAGVDNNNNDTEYPFGRDYTLKPASWDNHTFLGWYSDSSYTTEITEISSPPLTDIEQGIERDIVVYAKWGITVSFVDEQENLISNLTDNGDGPFTNPITLEMIPIARLYPSDYPKNPEDTSIRAFDGWVINGKLCSKEEEEYPELPLTENTQIKAQFHDIGYYVYIYAKYKMEEGEDPVNINPSQAGSYKTYFKRGDIDTEVGFDYKDTERGKYYQTKEFVSGDDIGSCLVTSSITAKKGYSIPESGIYAYNLRTGEEIPLNKAENDEQAYQFIMPDSDVCIIVNFEEGDYEIYYNEITDNDSVTRVELDTSYGEPVERFNPRTEPFKLIPPVNTDRYRRFIGWCEVGNDKTQVIKDNIVNPKDYLRTLNLYAVWEDIQTYPITINEEAKEYIKVYDEYGNEVDKGIPGEVLKIVVTTDRGVSYDSMTWYYIDENISDCVKEHRPADGEKTPIEYKFIMPPSDVDIVGEFSLIEYNITYLNVYGAVNPNPNTYTIKDKIDLEALEKEGVNFEGWKIVVPDVDNDVENGDYATKEEDISTIENMTGNLILVAHWDQEGDFNTLYRIFVGEDFSNGIMDSYADEAYEGQYVFLYVAPDRGYKLKNISYNDADPAVYSAEKALRAIEGILDINFDIPLYEVADGVYYFIMPAHDINLTAEFEPIEYTITYLDGNAEDNPAIYTVEDEIWLTAPSKDGFEFLGWYDDNDNLTSSIKDSVGNLTLTAKWKSLEVNPPEPPKDPETPPNPDNNKNPDSSNSNGNSNGNSQGVNTNNKPGSSVVDQLLTWINDKSKLDSSEDKSQNKGNIIQQISTGDKANISHLILLCIMSLIIIIIVCPKKREEEESR